MRVTAALRQYTCRLTLFTRKNCSLCEDAKKVLSNVWDRRPFEYDEIDVMEAHHEKWKGIYEFDTPVVSVVIQSDQVMANDSAPFRQDEGEQL